MSYETLAAELRTAAAGVAKGKYTVTAAQLKRWAEMADAAVPVIPDKRAILDRQDQTVEQLERAVKDGR